jgi:fructose transport system permease protein
VLFSVYTVAGLLYAIGGWILIGRLASASPNVGVDYNLDSITAVVIGGTSLFGGRGSVIGTLIGALIVGVFRNGLQLAGVEVSGRASRSACSSSSRSRSTSGSGR